MFDAESYIVYGYIVAIDMFGEALVMPMYEVLEDITRRLNVQQVSLPQSSDASLSGERVSLSLEPNDHESSNLPTSELDLSRSFRTEPVRDTGRPSERKTDENTASGHHDTILQTASVGDHENSIRLSTDFARWSRWRRDQGGQAMRLCITNDGEHQDLTKIDHPQAELT